MTLIKNEHHILCNNQSHFLCHYFPVACCRTIHLLYVMLLIFTTISCSMRIDGQTDVTKLKVSFSNFANTPKNIRCEITSFCHSVAETFAVLGCYMV
jgi:hypothetical protein